MRVRELEYNKEKSLMIYVSKQERYTNECIKEIENYKKNYKNVAIFVSGDRPMEETLKNIIKDFGDLEN